MSRDDRIRVRVASFVATYKTVKTLLVYILLDTSVNASKMSYQYDAVDVTAAV